MTASHRLLLAAVGASLLVTTTSAAAATPAPRIDSPTGAHLVATPSGTKLAVAVPVDYRLGDVIASVPRAALDTEARATAVLPNGTKVAAAPDRRRTGGASLTGFEHHLFFTPRQTRTLRTAHGVRLRVTARATVTPVGGAPAAATATRTVALPGVTAAAAPIAGSSHAQGDNPCQYYGLPVCTNVSGDTWSAHHFWASHSFTIACPSGSSHATQDTTVVTSSSRYSETTYENGNGDGVLITIIDDNIRHHPWTYTPWTACQDL